MQCLMTLPSLDVVFSTERQAVEDIVRSPKHLKKTTGEFKKVRRWDKICRQSVDTFFVNLLQLKTVTL